MIHYRVHKTCHCILSWATEIKFTFSHIIYLRLIIILSSHLLLCLPTDLFFAGFLRKIVYEFCAWIDVCHFRIFNFIILPGAIYNLFLKLYLCLTRISVLVLGDELRLFERTLDERPSIFIRDKSIFSSEKCSVEKKKISGRESQGPWCQDKLNGGKVTLTLTTVQLRVQLWSDNQWAAEAEESPLPKFVTRKRLVKILQSNSHCWELLPSKDQWK
jgi:hypothetical protein